MKHNKTWFYNRIGKRVFCNDHENPARSIECSGILLENKEVANNVIKNQERGIEFRD